MRASQRSSALRYAPAARDVHSAQSGAAEAVASEALDRAALAHGETFDRTPYHRVGAWLVGPALLLEFEHLRLDLEPTSRGRDRAEITNASRCLRGP